MMAVHQTRMIGNSMETSYFGMTYLAELLKFLPWVFV
jgi:hypothetical protein